MIYQEERWSFKRCDLKLNQKQIGKLCIIREHSNFLLSARYTYLGQFCILRKNYIDIYLVQKIWNTETSMVWLPCDWSRKCIPPTVEEKFPDSRGLIIFVVIDMNFWFSMLIAPVIVAFIILSIVMIAVIKTSEEEDNCSWKIKKLNYKKITIETFSIQWVIFVTLLDFLNSLNGFTSNK